jgi:hypothetical protein
MMTEPSTDDPSTRVAFCENSNNVLGMFSPSPNVKFDALTILTERLASSVEAEHTKSIVSTTNDILKSKRRFLGFMISSLSKLNLLDKYGTNKDIFTPGLDCKVILHPSGKYAQLTDWALTSPVTVGISFSFL